MIYTDGVHDTNYNRPLFAYLLSIATFLSCIRLPYQNTVEAAGQFKQTRNGAIQEAIINIVISIVLVKKFGCIGVAIGTIVAMAFRTIQYADYVSRQMINRPRIEYLKRILVSICTFIVIIIIYVKIGGDKIVLGATSYLIWIKMAIPIFIVITCFVFVVNFVFYPKLTREIFQELKNK